MQIFAHRGYSSRYPENTMTAFRKALEVRANGIELDARLTADGQLIVMHDKSVDRTTTGSGIVRDLQLAEIRRLDAGIKFGAAFENERVPLLEEVFAELGGKLLINVELCNYDEGDDRMLSNKVCDLIEKYKLTNSVILSSFRFNNLVYCKDRNPGLSCGLLAKPGFLGCFARNILSHSVSVDALHPNIADVSAGLIRREQLCGRKVRAWTVDDLDKIRSLMDAGVDAVFTNDPENVREFYVSESLLRNGVRKPNDK